MGDSAEAPPSVESTQGAGPKPLLPLAVMLVAYCVVSGGTATLVGALLSFAVTPGLRPWVWGASGALVAGIAGVLLDRGAIAAVRRFTAAAPRPTVADRVTRSK